MSQDPAASSGTTVVVVEETTTVPAVYGLTTRLAAEAFGTFVLVLGIVGTALFNALNQGSIIPMALAGGLALVGAFAAVGHVSGGHFNPAVTFGMVLAGRTPWRDLLPYWAAQLVGAALSAVVLWSTIPGTLPQLLQLEDKAAMLQATANGYGDHSPLARLSQGGTEFTVWSALLVEILIAAIFVAVYLGSTGARARVPYPAVALGLTLAGLHLVTWPVTNTSLNPARSFASALFGGGWTWGQLWLFLVAPLVGAALAALFYRAFSPLPVLPGEEDELVDVETDVEADAAEAMAADEADLAVPAGEPGPEEDTDPLADVEPEDAEETPATAESAEERPEGDQPGTPRA
jgi:aquaporin Z